MPKISVVIITYNEEKNIQRCIESVKEIADDILIVDSYSTDNTEKIVKECNSRFIQHPFEGHIEQKNWAIRHAKYPHILSLDADEAVSETLKKSILEIKDNWKYDGYYFNRLTNYCGKWIKYNSWYPSRKLRLWDSRKGKWGGLNPHDKFILNKNATKKHLKGDILHYSYYSISEHIQQIDRFSEITANSLFLQGKKTGFFKIILHPTWRFVRDYFLKLGFFDGFYGLVVCLNSSHETFLKYVKLKSFWREYYNELKSSMCFFNSLSLWGGGEKEHFDIVQRLHKNGHNLFLFTNHKGELFSRINQKKLRSYHISVNNLSFLNLFKILKIYFILKKEKVQTIFINLSSDLKVAGIAAKLAGVKNIIYRRGNAIPVKNTILNRYLYRSVATKVLVNSIETKRCVLENNKHLLKDEKITMIYNGIDLNYFNFNDQTKEIYPRKNNEILLGNAGRLSEEKGQKYLIEIAKILKEKNLNFKILIAGIGKLQNKLVKLSKEANVEDYVIFLGFIDNIKQFHESIDIFCLTSLFEGFGYAMVEAMAMKKPVVAFDINSSSEIVDDSKTGFLIEKFDTEKFASKLQELIENKDLREELGANGRVKVENTFDLQKVIDQLEHSILLS